MEENKSAFSNDNIYANVNPTETTNNGAGAYSGAAGQPGAGAYGGAGGAGGYGAPGYNGNAYAQSYAPISNEVKCPGKEITSMILGIFSLFYGVFGIIFCWMPIYAWIFGLFAVGCGIPSIILHNSVMKIATVTTKKVKVGKNLGVAGIITGAAAMVLDIIVIIIFAGVLGTSIMSEFY